MKACEKYHKHETPQLVETYTRLRVPPLKNRNRTCLGPSRGSSDGVTPATRLEAWAKWDAAAYRNTLETVATS
jgi:hypothetical protein